MTIKIGGKERPIVGNFNGLKELKKDHGIDVMQGFEMKSVEAICSLFYIALKYGHIKENKGKDVPLGFTIEDVGDWLDMKEMGVLLPVVIKAFLGDVEVKLEDGKSGEQVGPL